MNKCEFNFFALLLVLCLALGYCGPCVNEKVVTELNNTNKELHNINQNLEKIILNKDRDMLG